VPKSTIEIRSAAVTISSAEDPFLVTRGLVKFSSTKAKEFANWICETVLPEIRKTGFFGAISIKDQISISRQIDSISLQIVNNKNAFRRKLLQDPLRRLCNIVN